MRQHEWEWPKCADLFFGGNIKDNFEHLLQHIYNDINIQVLRAHLLTQSNAELYFMLLCNGENQWKPFRWIVVPECQWKQWIFRVADGELGRNYIPFGFSPNSNRSQINFDFMKI